jgi:hypothetical protein
MFTPPSPLKGLNEIPGWIRTLIKKTIASETATTAGRFNMIGWLFWLITVLGFSATDYFTPLVNALYSHFNWGKVEEFPMWFILLCIVSLPCTLIWCVNLIIKSELAN